jgi:hypothetical protein
LPVPRFFSLRSFFRKPFGHFVLWLTTFLRHPILVDCFQSLFLFSQVRMSVICGLESFYLVLCWVLWHLFFLLLIFLGLIKNEAVSTAFLVCLLLTLLTSPVNWLIEWLVYFSSDKWLYSLCDIVSFIYIIYFLACEEVCDCVCEWGWPVVVHLMIWNQSFFLVWFIYSVFFLFFSFHLLLKSQWSMNNPVLECYPFSIWY